MFYPVKFSHLLSIISYQTCYQINNIRINSDFTFIFKTNNEEEIIKLYKKYFKVFFTSYKDFNDIFIKLDRYECFVIDNCKLYIYKAKNFLI